MSTKRIVALVVGCVMILPAIGMLLAGGALAVGYVTQRDDDGYFDVTIDQLQTPTAAITGEDVKFAADPGSPDWLIDAIDLDGANERADLGRGRLDQQLHALDPWRPGGRRPGH